MQCKNPFFAAQSKDCAIERAKLESEVARRGRSALLGTDDLFVVITYDYECNVFIQIQLVIINLIPLDLVGSIQFNK